MPPDATSLKPHALGPVPRTLRNLQRPLPPADLLVQYPPPLDGGRVLPREPLDLVLLELHHIVGREAFQGAVGGAYETLDDGACDVPNEIF